MSSNYYSISQQQKDSCFCFIKYNVIIQKIYSQCGLLLLKYNCFSFLIISQYGYLTFLVLRAGLVFLVHGV